MAFPDYTEKVDVVELSTDSIFRQLVGNIAYVVPDVTDLTDAETEIKTEIEKRYNINLFSSVDAGDVDWTNYNVILLSPGLTLADLDALKFIEKPVLTFDSSHPNQLLAMTTNAGTSSTNETQIDIQTIEQQIISGADITATGYTTVYSAADTLTGVTLAGVTDIIDLAVKVGTAYSCLCVLEKDAVNADGDPNPDIRIFFGMLSGDRFTATGLNLLLQALLYAGCMASNVSHSTYQLLKKLETIEYKSSMIGGFPMGDLYFVSTSGDDANDGTSWPKAKLTIAAAVPLCTPMNNDYIFVAPGNYDEDAAVTGVTCNVSSVHIIGPGDLRTKVDNSDAGAQYIFNVTQAYIEITGVLIENAVNTVEGIYVTGNFPFIHHNYISGAMENGIHINGSANGIVEHNIIQLSTNDGIELTNTDSFKIRHNDIMGVGDYGIHLNGNAVDDNFVYDNRINGRAGVTDIGINIVLGDNNIVVDNWIAECATLPIQDTGSNNIVVGNHVDKISGSFDVLVADAGNLTVKVTNIDLPSSCEFIIQCDIDTINENEAGKTVTIYAYAKVDGANYRIVDLVNFLAGTDEVHPVLRVASEGGKAKLRISTKMSAVVTATRAIPYKIVQVNS